MRNPSRFDYRNSKPGMLPSRRGLGPLLRRAQRPDAFAGASLRVELRQRASDLVGLLYCNPIGGDVQAQQGSAVHREGAGYCGLYLAPPERALVLCVDEKSQIQALDRTQPLLADGAPARSSGGRMTTSATARHPDSPRWT